MGEWRRRRKKRQRVIADVGETHQRMSTVYTRAVAVVAIGGLTVVALGYLLLEFLRSLPAPAD